MRGRPSVLLEIISRRGENIRALTDQAEDCVLAGDALTALKILAAINRELHEGAAELGYAHLIAS